MFDQGISGTRARRGPSGLAGFTEAGIAFTLEAGLGVGKVQFLRGTTAAYFSDLFGQPAPAARQSLWLNEVEICWLAPDEWRSEEHTSELQSLMRSSYAVFCLKKKTNKHDHK